MTMPRQINWSDITRQIKKAAALRAEHAKKFEALRLVDGLADQLPRFFLDKYGEVLVGHFLAEQQGARVQNPALLLKPQAQQILEICQAKAFYLWTHQASKQTRAVCTRLSQLELESCQVIEHQVRYLVKPSTQLNAGLFLDMRELRRIILENSKNLRALNLFCYTGSLGLCALLGGARSLVQVDVSKQALSWAKENLALNQTETLDQKISFINEDVLTFLEKEQRRIERGTKEPYDLVIIDPPSHGSSERGTFSLKNQLEELLTKALLVLKGDTGQIIFTCNLRELSNVAIYQRLEKTIKELGWQVKDRRELLPPGPDFRAQEQSSIASRGWWLWIGKK